MANCQILTGVVLPIGKPWRPIHCCSRAACHSRYGKHLCFTVSMGPRNRYGLPLQVLSFVRRPWNTYGFTASLRSHEIQKFTLSIAGMRVLVCLATRMYDDIALSRTHVTQLLAIALDVKSALLIISSQIARDVLASIRSHTLLLTGDFW